MVPGDNTSSDATSVDTGRGGRIRTAGLLLPKQVLSGCATPRSTARAPTSRRPSLTSFHSWSWPSGPGRPGRSAAFGCNRLDGSISVDPASVREPQRLFRIHAEPAGEVGHREQDVSSPCSCSSAAASPAAARSSSSSSLTFSQTPTTSGQSQPRADARPGSRGWPGGPEGPGDVGKRRRGTTRIFPLRGLDRLPGW